MTESDPIIVEVTVAAPPDAVWRALRDPAEIRRWHGWEYDDGGGLDVEIEEIFFSAATASDADLQLDTGGGVFELEPRGERTVVRVTRSAPTGEAGWDGIYDQVNEGWLMFTQQLRFALERHPGADRRTVHLHGRGPSPLDGLAGVAIPGERYEAATPWGERLAGEVWHRAQRQAGLTVDGYGDGLLILAASPGDEAAGRAILTTYGLGDAALDDLRERWGAWWRECYDDATVT